MKKAMRVSPPIVFTLFILFGPACIINSLVLVQWQFSMVMLETIVMFGSQPTLTRADLFNPTDKYSMLGISVMGVLVTNASAIEWAFRGKGPAFPQLVDFLGFAFIWGGLALRILHYLSEPVFQQSGDHPIGTSTDRHGYLWSSASPQLYRRNYDHFGHNAWAAWCLVTCQSTQKW